MAKAPRKTAEFIDTAGNEIDTVNPNVVTLDKPIKRAGQTIDKVTLIEPNAVPCAASVWRRWRSPKSTP